VVGSGIVAHEISSLWEESDGKLAFVDLSGLVKSTAYRSNSGIFNPHLLHATAKVGGGSGVWGGKVAIPNRENWFNEKFLSTAWHDFGNWVELNQEKEPKTEFTSQVRDGEARFNTTKASRFNRIGMISDRHIFLPDLAKLNAKVLEFAATAAVGSKLLEFRVGSSGGIIVFDDPSGNRRKIEFRNLLLAAGPVGNAVTLSLIDSQKVFPIGNHAQVVAGHIKFRFPKRFGLDAYLHHGSPFYSGAIPENGGNHAVRLVPDMRRVNSRGGLLDTKSRILGNLWRLALLRAGFTDSAGIFAMADTSGAGELRIDFKHKSLEVNRIELFFPPELENEGLQEEIRVLSKHLSKLAHVVDLTLGKKLKLDDAAHYFGTTPMSDNPVGNQVSNDFKLEGLKNAWSLGASSFPTGSHGHPTMLSILTAHRAVESMRK